ncbi:MIP family channel protein [Emericellopsis atlantica]|uniref:MIP family channel protein n=1 Tax=Emericellopsis atlantica TaxID=2614577 RepID=A0A9P7ZS21_9HYPO|nr:MIP family channel protein [Emericellopsis atlantica]KAG9256772.1 MIP family channel protein [Emericellopsis atlantica]
MSAAVDHISNDSVSTVHQEKSTTFIPVDKFENVGSMSQDENISARADSHAPPMQAELEPELRWSKFREYGRDFFSEFAGTMIMILFGDGVVAQVILSEDQKGNYQSISWGWGLGVMLGVYVASKSGGHLNPAVTLANCIYRGHPWRKFPVYFMGQLLGCMAGAFIMYGTYYQAFSNLEGGTQRTMLTAGIFCTYPADFLTTEAMWWSEFVSSTILIFVIFALADPHNGNAGKFMPLALFFLIFGIGACFGWQTGYAINLARDFGPRLVSYIVGYPFEVWSAGNYYFWIPMVAPFFGCTFGGFLYDVFIFTGESPINTPWMGLKRFTQPNRKTWSNTYRAQEISKV